MKLDDMIKQWRKDMDVTTVNNLIEHVEERAAIREFDAGIARLEAERLAMEEVEKRRKSVDRDKVVNK